MSVAEILEKTANFGARHVCVTGGEPLLQPEVRVLLTELCERGYFVSLETSGDISCVGLDPRVRKIIDIKTPSSGEFGRFNSENLRLENENVEYKFVIGSLEDFNWAESFSREHNLFKNFNVLYSPSFEQTDLRWLAEEILRQKSPARLQLQLHKYIWSPQQRGV